MNSTLGSLLLLVAVIYGACCAFLFALQRNFIYFPTPESANPAAIELRVSSGEESLQVWQLNPGQEQAILYFGGNAEDVAGNTPLFTGVFPDFTVYLVNYRGYGGSSGAPSEAALYADAVAVYDRIARDHVRISAIGRSLGSGVAVHLASRRALDKLALVTPYDSIANVASRAMPLFPVGLLLTDRFESQRVAPGLDIPALALMAENDNVIPRARSEALVASFKPELITSAVIPGTDHNSIGEMISYWDALREFLVPWN